MSTSRPDAPEPPRSRTRFDLRFILSPRFQHGLLALVVSCLTAFLMIDYVRLPSVDLKVGDIAGHNVRADQSFEFTDQEATRKARDQAERSVRPVFDLDPQASKAVITRVRQAFSTMRAQAGSSAPAPGPAAEGAPATPENAKKLERAAEGISRKGERAAVEGSARRPDRIEDGAKRLERPGDLSVVDPFEALNTPDKRREFFDLLGVDLLEVFYQNLVYLRFDARIENGIASVLDSVLSRPVIADRSVLPEDLATGGITVVSLGEPLREERTLYTARNILDLDEARRLAGEVTQEMFGEMPQFQRDTIAAAAFRLVHPTLTYNAAQTAFRRQQARASLRPVTYQVKKGTMVVRAGDPIDAQKLLILQGIAKAKADYRVGWMFGAVALFTGLLLVATYYFASSYIRKFSTSIKDLLTVSLVLVFVIALTRIGVEVSNALAAYIPEIPITSYYYAAPLACGAMVIRLLMNSETAFVFSVVASALTALLMDYNVFFPIYFFLSSIAAAGGMAHTKERVHVLRGGLLAAGCNVLAMLAIFLIQANMVDARFDVSIDQIWWNVGFAFCGGIGAAIIALGILPIFEMFGYVTDYKLLELANLNHPLLRELMVRAPGTYHHSVIVGNLSEAAAQAIRANALLARVGCYYHDIGKMRKPEYFIENLRDPNENRHDRLDPHMSALIIASHVRDGIEMARQHRLPQAIIDLIPGHHGTSLISFFFNKARQNATDADLVDENDFRYPGPKPQTREAGIVMLADATEASTRSIKNVNSAKIRMNLQKIFQRVIADGQLDECPLTLKDLAVISDSFHRTLLGIYHNRIEYPPDFRPGASVAGEGTGAVITLDSDGVIRPDPARMPGRSPAGAASAKSARVEDLSATTTAEIPPLTPPKPQEPDAASSEEPRASEGTARS